MILRLEAPHDPWRIYDQTSEPSFVPETKNITTQFSSRESRLRDLECHDLLFGDYYFSAFNALCWNNHNMGFSRSLLFLENKSLWWLSWRASCTLRGTNVQPRLYNSHSRRSESTSYACFHCFSGAKVALGASKAEVAGSIPVWNLLLTDEPHNITHDDATWPELSSL